MHFYQKICCEYRRQILYLRRSQMWSTTRINFRTTSLLALCQRYKSVECGLFLYADDSCLVYQHKELSVTEEQLNRDFANICDWFVNNKRSIHFGEDKTKSKLFTTKNKNKSVGNLNIKYNNINI